MTNLPTVLIADGISKTVQEGDWTHVVLQGAMLSMSQTNRYDNSGAAKLARVVNRSGARPLFFSEWPRKGVDELDYIDGVYNDLARNSGAWVISTGTAFKEELEINPGANLWASDGNHSSAMGARIAAKKIASDICAQLMLK